MSIKSIILVSIQIAAMGYMLIATNPIDKGFGLALQVLGFMIVLWGMLSIKIGNFNIQPEVKSNSLITKGPYKIIGNPMYTGVLLISLPIVLKILTY